MPTRVLVYVYCVLAAAVGALAQVWVSAPAVDYGHLLAATGLVLLGSYAGVAKYRAGQASHGEVSHIPYLTGVVIYPHWSTVTLVGVAVAVVELCKAKHPLKRVFNSAQLLLSTCVAAMIYLAFGGVSLLDDSTFRFLPHTAGVLAYLLVNSFAVAGVVALAERRNLFSLIAESHKASFVYDLFAVPVVFGVARAFTDWGWWGLLAAVVMLRGIRIMYQAKVQLENTNRELMALFVHTVEFKDPYTSGHSLRVARISKIIAHAVGLPSREVQRIGKAALVHDVGKIHQIFEPVLRKPGALTPEERAIMELHPIKSAELVSKLSDFEDVIADVRHHHENYDGTGYPDRLVGKSIPLGSRVIIFADTIDAMTTDRPYRKALGPDAVRAELLRCRGSQFDPDICDALLASPQYELIFGTADVSSVLSVSQLLGRVKRVRTLAGV